MGRLSRVFSAFFLRATVALALLGVAALVTWFSASSALPELGSSRAIEDLLRQSVEGTRAVEARRTLQPAVPFAVDDDLFLSPAGKALLGSYGCVDQPAAAPEASGAFKLRLFARWLRRPPSPGPGKCELSMAEELVRLIGPEWSRNQRLLAAARVREALPHHLLSTYWGSTYPFTATGPFGLDEASGRLFGKPAGKLDWSEAAMLALSTDFYEEVQTCRHPPKLKSLRDPFLDRLASLYPAEATAILAQKSYPLPCDRPSPFPSAAKP